MSFSLLVRKISGELSKKQKKKLNKLLKSDYKALNELKLLEKIWEDLDEENPRNILYNNKTISYDRTYIYIKLAAAAVILIGLIISLLFIKTTTVYQNNSSSPLTLTLPDQSIVILDTNAFLGVRKNIFGKFTRQVVFSGRAYFQISKSEHPFVLKCKNLSVKVLGTKFNISETNQYTNIVLVEGKIKVFKFSNNPDTSIYLLPNNKLYYNPSTKTIILKKTNPNVYTFWLKDKIQFENFSLADIGKILKLYYNKVLVFDTSKYNQQIAGSAPADDYLLIIKALAFITNSDYIIKNDTVFLKKQKIKQK